MPELKPCPFCGGVAGILRQWGGYAPYCENGYKSGKKVCYMAPRFPAFNTEEQAAEAWNRRATDGE